jgi:prepilin-type N-terminal cleavage/methylation domain-containing protein
MKRIVQNKQINRRFGFTLVELLVVISIIALLLSILMPTLNKVRIQAKITVCATNLRQLGLGVAMYMVSNNDHYPSYYSMPQANSWTTDPSYYDKTSWPRLIQRYLDGGNAAPNQPFTKAFYCPLGPIPGKTIYKDTWGQKSKWPNFNSHYVTYGYNQYALGDNAWGVTAGRAFNVTPTSSKLRASEFLVMIDNLNITVPSMTFTAMPSSRKDVSRHHPQDKANILYGDNHVGATTRKEVDDAFCIDPPKNRQLNSTKCGAGYPWKMLWEQK